MLALFALNLGRLVRGELVGGVSASARASCGSGWGGGQRRCCRTAGAAVSPPHAGVFGGAKK